MAYQIVTTGGELYHFGTKGMKWGVRRYQNEDGSYKSGAEGRYDPESSNNSGKTKNAFSLKAAGHKALSKVYGINEKAYAKSNKTLSSMNAHAKEEQLKKAKDAQDAANKKRQDKQNRKDEINKVAMQLKEKDGIKGKLIYGNRTYAKAGKQVIDGKKELSTALHDEKVKAWAKIGAGIVMIAVGSAIQSKAIR